LGDCQYRISPVVHQRVNASTPLNYLFIKRKSTLRDALGALLRNFELRFTFTGLIPTWSQAHVAAHIAIALEPLLIPRVSTYMSTVSGPTSWT
jgi:hypothetical protein